MTVIGKLSALRNRRGQALAEFALVLPLVLLFIAGIIEMGRAWNIKQAVTDAAREGARYGVVQDPTIKTTDDVKAKIQERLALASIDTSTTTVDFSDTFHDTDKEFSVTVSTPYQMGLIGAILAWGGAPSVVTISTEATMRNEGFVAAP
jgi:Flp pilus assembly protein TadG